MTSTLHHFSNPCQTILVSCRGHATLMGSSLQKDNLITIDWHTIINQDPLLYGIAVGKTRFSHNLISESRVFCINFLSAQHESAARYCGRTSGKFTNKFIESKLTKIECENIDCPAISEALTIFECEVIEQIDFSDHTFFIGKVVRIRNNNNTSTKRLIHLQGDRFTTC